MVFRNLNKVAQGNGKFGQCSSFTPKGVVQTFSMTISNLIFRQALSSACQTAILTLGTAISSTFSTFLAEIVVAVGSIDLVVGELDR